MLNVEDIKQLIRFGESEILELKKSTAQIKAACETACAFLNGNGGIVIIGITDDLKIVGQEISDKTKRDVGNELAKITPVPHIKVDYLNLAVTDRYVIIFQITTDSYRQPYMYDGKAFMRNQSNTIPMPREYLNQLTLLHAAGASSWEHATLSDVTIDDLDATEILATIKDGCLNGRIPSNYDTNNPWEALQRLNLIENNKITNAGIVLFAKEPQRKYPQCVMALARFKGIDKAEFIDNRRISANVFKLLEQAMYFFSLHFPIASTFSRENILRKDTPFIPITVLREAVANALCHRDYSFYSGSISIGIYDDRLEIWNYGLFPRGVSLKHLDELKRSMPRNQLIANVLYYHKVCEAWGRGIHMIVEGCIQAGHMKPFYVQDEHGTLLTIPFGRSLGGSSDNSGEQQDIKALTSRQTEILKVIALLSGECTSGQILAKISDANISSKTLRRDLATMEKLGYIIHAGLNRGTKWKLKK